MRRRRRIFFRRSGRRGLRLASVFVLILGTGWLITRGFQGTPPLPHCDSDRTKQEFALLLGQEIASENIKTRRVVDYRQQKEAVADDHIYMRVCRADVLLDSDRLPVEFAIVRSDSPAGFILQIGPL